MRAREFLKEQIQDVQRAITNKVNTIFDVDELNKIHAYVSRIDIGSGFESLFNKDVDLKQVKGYLSRAINEAPGTVEEKIGFAKELVTKGVIDVDALLVPNQSTNIMDAVKTSYPEIFDAVAPELLNISGSFAAGGVKTNKGKGEFFLALVSPQVTLSKGAGDVIVKGRPVEVKANLSRIKGRSGYGTTDSAINKVEANVGSFLKKNLKNNNNTAAASVPTFTVTLSAKSTLWDQFGPYCIQQGIDSGLVVKFLREQLQLMVTSLYLNLDNTALTSLLSTINDQTGKMDKAAFLDATQQVAFNYYKNSDKFEGIFFLNGDTMNCVYIEDAESFAAIINVTKWGYEPGQQNGLQIRT